MMFRFNNEQATKQYYNHLKKNEVSKKHIRKYRIRCWAVNQIEENHEEEAADLVADLDDPTSLPLPEIASNKNYGAVQGDSEPTQEETKVEDPEL